MVGTVYLVGAGPSDAGLLTCRGQEVLQSADVVVYDALVGEAILALVPPEARCINVGKRARNHTRTQDEINRILLEEALAGHTVVRLKGGDPFLFGRGGEELELLAANGIPYEVVPGITSAIAVPAYQGIPVTHRDFCSSVHIITAHKRRDEPLDLDFDALVRLNGTLVFLMGVTALPSICSGLLRAGMSPEMPAAVLHRGTSARQKRVVSTLSALPEAAKALEAPSIIVVGRVCALADTFAWAEKRPLSGMRFLVTRPRERASSLTGRLRKLGGEVIEFPTIRLHPLEDIPWEALDGCRWLVLTSPSGADLFFRLLKAAGRDVRSLSHLKIAALGSGTGAQLEQHGILPDLIPSTYDAGSLGAALAARLEPGDRVFIARARQGSPELTARLREVPWADVLDVPIYETVYTRPPILEPLTLLDGSTWAVFTSASTVRGFAAAAGTEELSAVRALCIGAQTALQAEAFGMQTSVSAAATVDSLVELALSCAKENT